jgi:di/tricarboxylate transporter
MTLSLDWLAVGPLSGHGMLLLAFTIGVFVVFAWDRFRIGSVCLAVLILLPALFFVFPLPGIDPYRFLGGFGHPALVAICALMVLGHALVLTGALEPAARRLSWLVERAPWLALLAVLVGAAALSGVMNDTPVVVLMIPLLVAALRRAGRAPAFMLLPMNYAVLIGGMATTIGTSTNLIVVSLAAGLGVTAFGVFDFFPLVATAALPALAYLWLVAPWMLRHVEPAAPVQAQPVFDAELRILPGSPLDGVPVRELMRRTRSRLPLRQIRRAGGSLTLPLPTAVLRAGDRLVVQDTVENLKEFEARLGTPLHDFDLPGRAGRRLGRGGPAGPAERSATADAAADRGEAADAAGEAGTAGAAAASVPADAADAADATDDADDGGDAVAAQLIVTPQSPLVGRTVRGERLADKYRLTLIGLRKAREGAEVHRGDLADLRVEAGDVLLMQGRPASLRLLQRDGVGLMLDERLALPRARKSPVALLTLAGVVAAASLGGVPIALAAMVGVLVLLATRAVAWRDVGAALSINVVLLVAASLALGDALTVTGGTAFLARAFLALADGLPAPWVLAALMALIGLLTNFVTNNAAAAIGTPLAVEVARSLGLPPEPYVLAVLFGCNLCYVTPMAYQTNLLVMNVGGYRFADFVRVGAPLFLIMWIGLSMLLASRYAI